MHPNPTAPTSGPLVPKPALPHVPRSFYQFLLLLTIPVESFSIVTLPLTNIAVKGRGWPYRPAFREDVFSETGSSRLYVFPETEKFDSKRR
jgi:hypothetical protein